MPEPSAPARASSTLEQIVTAVLTSGLPLVDLSTKLKIPRSRVSRIAYGHIHADICPELPRRDPRRVGALLTPEQVRTILTSTINNTALARQFNVSPEAVSQVRRGKTFRNLFPELPRTGAKHLTNRNRPRLTEAERLEIITSTESTKVLAQRFNRQPETIRGIRSRARNQPLAAIDCRHCHHYNASSSADPCRMGFPEAIEDPAFAGDCSLFEANT